MENLRTPDAFPTSDRRIASPKAASTQERTAWHEAAVAFEAAFLTEMLAHTGLGRLPEGFGGGAGEEAFASFLRREQARLLAESGAIGLVDAIQASLEKAGGRET